MDTSSINFTEIVLQTINSLFQSLFSSIDNSLYSLLDEVTFLSPDILKDSYFDKIFGTSSSNGILLIANSLLIGFLLYYGLKFLLSHLTFSQLESPQHFLFKIILFTVAMNSSFFLCEQLLSFNFLICNAIRNLGETLFHKNICFSELIHQTNSIISVDSPSLNIFSIDGMIKSFVSISLLNLIFSYSLRYIMIKVLLLLSPFAILSLSTQNSSWFFKSWFRSFLSLLVLQIFISLVLLITFSIDFQSNLFSKFLYLGSLYALIKSNSYVREFLGGISTQVNTNFRFLKGFSK